MATIVQRTADRVKIQLTTTERQIIFNRTGLDPAKSLWANSGTEERSWHIAVYGCPPEPSCPHREWIGQDGAPH